MAKKEKISPWWKCPICDHEVVAKGFVWKCTNCSFSMGRAYKKDPYGAYGPNRKTYAFERNHYKAGGLDTKGCILRFLKLELESPSYDGGELTMPTYHKYMERFLEVFSNNDIKTAFEILEREKAGFEDDLREIRCLNRKCYKEPRSEAYKLLFIIKQYQRY